MRPMTLHGRLTLWSAGVVATALVLFGAGAAWNLRDELEENLDHEIKTEAHDFFAAIKQRPVDWHDPHSVEALFDQSKRFHYVEIRDTAGRPLYRSDNLEGTRLLPNEKQEGLRNLAWRDRNLRVGVFTKGGITLALGKDTEETHETLAELGTAYLLALPLVVIAVALGSWWIARRAVAPVRAIAAQADKISASDLHQRIPPSASQDELSDLARVLNEMFDRLQRSFEQITRFTSDASHELKTPLALMRAQVESALDSPAPPERDLLCDVIEQCSQLSQIVDSLLFLSRTDDRRLAIAQDPVDLVALVRELIEDAEILAAPSGLFLRHELPVELLITGDLRLLRRAAMNLIDNAIKYTHPGGSVVLAGSLGKGEARLSVGNTGPGISAEAQTHIFDRFYRNHFAQNEAAGGYGLGLSIAREIARAHGGDVTLVCSDSRWTEFALALPSRARPDGATVAVSLAAAVGGHHPE